MKNVLKVFCSIILSLILLSCAGQFSPPGGPPDTTPPEILLTMPAPNTLNFHGNTITLHFSKYVERRSVEEAIFLSPPLGRVTFEWSGKDVDIHFADTLRENTTYIMMIGTDVTDTRNNKMAKAFPLAFSTGEYIDSAMVSGAIFDEKPSGIMIFAYQLDNRLADTLNPSRLKPDYVTQTGKDGSFTLTNLALGTYRLFAIRDTYKNLLYDPQTDEYGVAQSDVHSTAQHASVTGIQFRMTSEDTTRPFLSSARAIDHTHILLRFSEAMDSSTFSQSNIDIIDTLIHSPLTIYDFSFKETLLDAEVLTAVQDSNKAYRVALHGCTDVHGNRINEQAGNGEFTGSALQDTMKLSVRIEGIADSAKNVAADDSLRFFFSKAVHRTTFERGFHLQDTSKRDIGGKFVWWNSSAVSFIPNASLLYGNWYTVRVNPDSVLDAEGNRTREKTIARHFKIIDESQLSSIAGEIADDSSKAHGKIYVIANDLLMKSNPSKTIVVNRPGPFIFQHLPEGKYSLFAFRDADSNGVYTYGKISPFQSSERFVVYPDTLKVRARWPLEGVQIRFR